VLRGGDPPIHVEVFDIAELGLLGSSGVRSVLVDEGVREDSVEPGLQVRALLETAIGAIGLEEGLLDEVLGVRRVPCHPQGG
jgi:hypothetical protein